MKQCNVIADLLPLYLDGVCSEDSKSLVESHLSECEGCRSLLQNLKSTETDGLFDQQKANVITGQKKLFRRKSFTVGAVFAGIFTLPILVCLIVNLAVGAVLDWFFIVLAALMLAGSLIVVPLMLTKHRLFATITSSTGCLILLFAVCAIYTGGDWFFVASSASLFGISLVLLPIVVRYESLNGILKRNKALFVMTVDTVLLVMMYLAIAFQTGFGFFPIAMIISFPFLVLVWGIFAVIRYLPWSEWIRAAFVSLILGLFVFFLVPIFNGVFELFLSMPTDTRISWDIDHLAGDLYPPALIVGVVLAAVFTIIYYIRKKVNSCEK